MSTVQDYYANRAQYGLEDYTTATPEGDQQAVSYNPGYLGELLALRQKVQSGQASAWEREWYQQQEAAARAIPMRDVRELTYDAGTSGAGQTLSGASPDLGGIMLRLAERIDAGQATDQERALFRETEQQLRYQNWKASVPQPSDAFNPMGDQFFSALGVLGLGATGGLAAAPLAAGGASLATTLGSLGTLSGVAGTGAGVLGQATDQPWLSTAGLALGALGGVAGGASGLSSLWNTGVQSVGEAARAVSSLGRVTGAVGTASGSGPLRQAAGYLGLSGRLGGLGAGVPELLSAAEGAQQGATDVPWTMASQREGNGMEWGDSWDDVGDQQAWESFLGWGDPTGPGSSGDPNQSWMDFVSWDDPTGPGSSGDLGYSGDSGSGGWGSLGASALSTLRGLGGFLGSNAGWLGPAASTLGGLGAGAIGATAARNATDTQTATLNRGLDLQTAQWLQAQANQAPWLAAGQDALGHMRGRMAWEGPAQPGTRPAVSGANYALPSATPGWSPQTMDAAPHRYTPGAGPQAANFRYTPGATPDAAAFRSGAPQLYQGAMPGTRVPTLTGQQVLDQDPGVRFRLDEARRGLEASALTQGTGLSGPALQALQRQSQELASQEYAPAWGRMMARDESQYGRDWNQYLQQWTQGVQGTELGLQTNAQNFGQEMSAAQLREQVAQVASQQGWSQAQAEAALREATAQQASSQNFGQDLQARAWNQAQTQQYDADLYNRLFQQSQVNYGRDVYQDETDVQRQQQAYAQQMAELARQWNQFASVSGAGQVSAGRLGAEGSANADQMSSLLARLGAAQGQGALNQGNAWGNALQNVNAGVQGGLGTLAYQQGLAALLNR